MSSNEFKKHDDEGVICLVCLHARDHADLLDWPIPVCIYCWQKIPEDRRIWLNLVCQSNDQGGLGLRELFEAGLKDLDLVKAFGHRPGSVN